MADSGKAKIRRAYGGEALATNPRYKNGNFRRKWRARFRAADAPCGICGGRLGPIHYDEPSDAAHPLSFVIDEIRPVSKWKQYGYDSAASSAQDIDNLQAAHYVCNQRKGNRTGLFFAGRDNVSDGDW